MPQSQEVSLREVARLLCAKEFSKTEKDRLSSDLSDEISATDHVFWRNYQTSSVFRTFAHETKINGYPRPGKKKTEQIDKKLRQDLTSNKANNKQWFVYTEVCWAHIDANQREISLLLEDEVEIESTDTTTVSETLIKYLCSHAAENGIYKKDIEEFYSLFPVKRLENINELLDLAPEYGELNELSDQVQSYQLQLETLDRTMQERFSSFKNILFSSDANTKNLVDGLEAKLFSLKEHAEYSFGDLAQKLKKLDVSNDLDDWKRELETKYEVTYKQYSKAVKQAEEERDKGAKNFQDQVLKIGADMEDLQGYLDEQLYIRGTSEGTSSSSASVRGQEWISEQLTQNEQDLSAVKLKDSTESNFLENFRGRCANERMGYSTDSMEIYHKLLLAAPVARINDPDLFGCWIQTLGWQKYHYQIAASPTWSDPEVWYKLQKKLFQEHSDPVIISILDFDKGLVAGYLEPILRVWSQFNQMDTTKKIILINSEVEETESLSDCASPMMHLDRYEPPLDFQLAEPIPDLAKHGVTPSSFVSWTSDINFSVGASHRNKLVRKLLEMDLVLPRSLLRLVNRAENGLKEFEKSTVEKFILNLIVMPWLQVAHNEQVVDQYESSL